MNTIFSRLLNLLALMLSLDTQRNDQMPKFQLTIDGVIDLIQAVALRWQDAIVTLEERLSKSEQAKWIAEADNDATKKDWKQLYNEYQQVCNQRDRLANENVSLQDRLDNAILPIKSAKLIVNHTTKYNAKPYVEGSVILEVNGSAMFRYNGPIETLIALDMETLMKWCKVDIVRADNYFDTATSPCSSSMGSLLHEDKADVAISEGPHEDEDVDDFLPAWLVEISK